jgi:hypothetical protein
VAIFFIDTDTGQVATVKQLVEAGIATEDGQLERPWLRIQGSNDATTMWYAVMRRAERGIFIGSLVIRHSPHHALLLERGWQEVPVEEIRLGPGRTADQSM